MKKCQILCKYRNFEEIDHFIKTYHLLLFNYNKKKIKTDDFIDWIKNIKSIKCHQYLIQYHKFYQFIHVIHEKICKSKTTSALYKEKKIKEYLYNTDLDFLVGSFWPFNHHNIIIEPVIKNFRVYDSANYPFKLEFKTDKENHSFIYKYGDDLTKDLFILTMADFISRILNTSIIIYKVLPFSHYDGIIEFRDSLDKMYMNRKLKSLIHCSKINEDNFVKSYSFFLTISYIFGIGDRNFDNIVFTENGSLFFIDYSYILGDDPKFYFEFFIPKEIDNVIDEDIYSDLLNNIQSYIKVIRNNYDLLIEKMSMLIDTKMYGIDKSRITNYVTEKLYMSLDDKRASYMIENLFLDNIRSYKATFVSLVNKIGKLMRK